MAIKALPPNDPDSFWVIASYHGSPLASFDEAQPHVPPPFAWWGGYCHHGNVLFPTWHRAYVQRLEDALRAQVSDKDTRSPSLGPCSPRAPKFVARSLIDKVA